MTMLELQEEVLTEPEAAKILKVSTSGLRAMRHHGLSPRWFKTGRLVRYRCASLQEFINREQGGEPPVKVSK